MGTNKDLKKLDESFAGSLENNLEILNKKYIRMGNLEQISKLYH
jgi:hypothetical protein